MFKKTLSGLMFGGMLAASSMAWAFCSGGCDCCRCPNGPAQCMGSYSSCEAACGLTSNSGGSGNSGYDNGAAIREQQRLEAERRAEEQRQRDTELERQRREADNRRLIEEAARQAKFLEDRDAAASTLRGSTGTRATSSGSIEPVLRGSTTTSGSSGLRGSSADTGLRGAKSDTAPTPNLDPMVVDARVAPLGANLLSQVPELERSPAADRIRKGYQAVMTAPRDWPVALAWWQEALQRDPNNKALMRSVDLAQWMVNSRNRAAGRPTHTDPVIDAFMRGDAAGVKDLIEQAKIRKAIQAAEAERMKDIVDKQVKQRAAAPKLPKLSKKSATMAQMATAGDRALSEQMFEDGLQFLNMGDYEHAEEMFRQADFQRNFDAGKPSSPGATANKAPGNPGKKR